MKRNEYVNFLTPKKVLQLQLTADGMDGSLVENLNDSYMTADESGNTTQFFSVLEDSNAETTLDNISYGHLDEHDFTFTNVDESGVVIKEAINEPEDTMDSELVIFKSPHSSKLFGLQTTTDEEGNLQKYQYEVLQNDQGQFVSISDTVQIVPYETDPAAVIEQMEGHLEEPPTDCQLSTEGVDHIEPQGFIKGDFGNLGIKLENDNFEQDLYITLEQPDQKHLSLVQGPSKIEDQIIHDQINDQFHDLCLSLENDASNKGQVVTEDPLQDRYIPEFTNHVPLDISEESCEGIQVREVVDDEDISQPAKQCILESALKGIYSPVKSEHHEFYTEELLELENVPEEGEVEEEQVVKQIIPLQKMNGGGTRTIALYPISRNMIKQRNKVITTIELPRRAKPLKTLNAQKRPVSTTSSTVTSAVVISPQKENLEVKSALEHIGHGISIIKRNNVKRTLNKVELAALISTSAKIEAAKASTSQVESKEKKKNPTWNVNTMISQTKIIEAPIRQERLPRKQKIKPLSRVGEELVFQHVTVTANGMIETKVDGVVQELKVLQPSECIQLSDSEDDFTRKARRKAKKQKKIEIIISDSEDEDDSVEPEKEPQPEVQKEDAKDTHSCGKCKKVFPSIGSLNTHMQHHSLEEKSEDITNVKEDKSSADKKPSKYACSICSETFINAFLHNKHVQLHKSRMKNECAVCKRLFSNLTELNRHMKEHNKPNTTAKAVPKRKSFRNLPKPPENDESKKEGLTTKIPANPATVTRSANSSLAGRRRSIRPPTVQGARKSMLPPPSVGLRKSMLPVKPRASTAPSANATAAKRPFKCFTCGSTYPSKVTLDSHIINNCVKSPRRTPPKLNRTVNAAATTSKLTSTATQLKSASTQSLNATMANRSSVSASFKRAPLSARHRIPTNAGIPVNTGMRKAFNNLKRKLKEEEDWDSDDLDKDCAASASND